MNNTQKFISAVTSLLAQAGFVAEPNERIIVKGDFAIFKIGEGYVAFTEMTKDVLRHISVDVIRMLGTVPTKGSITIIGDFNKRAEAQAILDDYLANAQFYDVYAAFGEACKRAEESKVHTIEDGDEIFIRNIARMVADGTPTADIIDHVIAKGKEREEAVLRRADAQGNAHGNEDVDQVCQCEDCVQDENVHPYYDVIMAFARDTTTLVQYRCNADEVWEDISDEGYPTFTPNLEWRVKPEPVEVETPTVDIPWELVRAEFNFAAMDKDGEWWFYTTEPVLTKDSWRVTPDLDDGTQNWVESPLVIEKLDNWKESLQKR